MEKWARELVSALVIQKKKRLWVIDVKFGKKYFGNFDPPQVEGRYKKKIEIKRKMYREWAIEQ